MSLLDRRPGRPTPGRTPAASGSWDRAADPDTAARALETLADVCERAAAGDLEVRAPRLDGSPEGARTRTALNRLLDLVDAYVRESNGVLVAASTGRYHRTFLRRGMPGTFRQAAVSLSASSAELQAADERARRERDARERAEREALAERMVAVAAQVAETAQSVAGTASRLATAAHDATAAAQGSRATVRTLEETSRQIQEAVALVKSVASRTRLLALNAAIEAARAGEAGRGFAVVADEVRTLADDSADRSDDIARQVLAAQAAAEEAGRAIESIDRIVDGMTTHVATLAATAEGNDGTGLAQTAARLRTEITRFAGLS